MRIPTKYVSALVVVGVLFLFAAIMPWIDGLMFKATYLNFLSSIDDKEQSKIRVVEYHVGWLNSYAKINISATGLPADDGLTMDQHISHGPFAFDSSQNKRVVSKAFISSVGHILPEQFEQFLLGGQAASGIFQVTTIVSFSDNFTSQFQIPALNIAARQQKLTTQAVTGDASMDYFNSYVARVTSNVNFGSMNLQTPSSTFLAEGIATQGELTCKTVNQCSSIGSLVIANLAQNALDGSSFKLSNFMLNGSYTVDMNNLYSSDFKVSAAKLTTTKLFNFDYQLEPINLTFTIKNLNVAPLENFANSAQHVKSSMDGTAQLEMMGKFNNALPLLITPNTLITKNLVINSNLGSLTSDTKAFWPAKAPLPVTIDDVKKNINIQSQTKISAALVDKVVSDIDQSRQNAAPFVYVPTPAPVTTQAEVQITAWFRDNKISDTEARDLITLQKLGLSPEIYAMSIDKVVKEEKLPLAFGEELKKFYLDQLKVVADQKVVSQTIAKSPTVGELRGQLDALIKQGFIKVVNAQYVVSAIYEKGVLKINDIVVPLDNSVVLPIMGGSPVLPGAVPATTMQNQNSSSAEPVSSDALITPSVSKTVPPVIAPSKTTTTTTTITPTVAR